MARGRVGGIRSRKSGKCGDEVYSVRRESDGSYSQVVSAYDPTRNDTLTLDLVRQRMFMSMLYRWMHAIPQVLGESFYNEYYKPLNLQMFIRKNIEYLQTLTSDPESYTEQPYYYDYGDPNVYPVPLLISDGGYFGNYLAYPSRTLSYPDWFIEIQCGMAETGISMAWWKERIGMKDGDVFALIAVCVDWNADKNQVFTCRYRVKATPNPDAMCTVDLVRDTFEKLDESPWSLQVYETGAWNMIHVSFNLQRKDVDYLAACGGAGHICSRVVDGEWRRSTAYIHTWPQSGEWEGLQRTYDDVIDSWYYDRI